MRADLLALDEDSLSALSNRGIVKRASREVAEGNGPVVTDVDGTVTGTFSDGTTVVLPPGATLEQAPCSCPASGVCRHRVMVVLAYRADVPPATETEQWTPAEFIDDQIEAVVGARVLAAARKTHRAGYRARVRRPSAVDPVATVELPSCAVRFLVPHELGYARVDAAQGTRADAIALAVWAFRAADTAAPNEAVLDLMVGGEALAAEERGSGIEEALPFLAELLADGVAHAGPSLATSATCARRSLETRNLRWPIDALDELTGHLQGYRDRLAQYTAEAAAAAMAELVGRHRCVLGGGASLRSDVLGTEETAETPLRLLRLSGLGARVSADGAGRTIEVYLAHPEAGVVLTVRRRVELDPDAEPPPARELARRKLGGARLSALAAGNVVTESAVRSANRLVRIAEARVAKTTVSPSTGAWKSLPPGVLVTDLNAEAARLAGLPPAIVRPRIVAESLRAVEVAEVEGYAWLPGEQRLVASIRAPQGSATLSVPYSAASPGAVDASADAFEGGLRFVAGHVRRLGGGLVIEPTALVVGDAVVVPAFAEVRSARLDTGITTDGDALTAGVREAIAISADMLHRGWRHLPPSWAAQVDRVAERLRGLSFDQTAQALLDLVAAARSNASELEVLDRWATTHLRLLVTAEQL